MQPPYIPTGDLAALDHSVKDFEPMMALDGGEDGLDFFYRVITTCGAGPAAGGHLPFEVGIGQAEKVAWLMVKAGYENIRITRDTGGIDRVVEGQRPKRSGDPRSAARHHGRGRVTDYGRAKESNNRNRRARWIKSGP